MEFKATTKYGDKASISFCDGTDERGEELLNFYANRGGHHVMSITLRELIIALKEAYSQNAITDDEVDKLSEWVAEDGMP